MKELYHIAVGMVNLPLTIFLVILVLYWLFSIFIGLDFDIDADIDIEMDVDVDMDASSSIDMQDASNTEIKREHAMRTRGKLNVFQVFLVYFNFVGLPFMFTLTAFVLFWWGISMLGTSVTHSYNTTFGFVFFFGGILPALFVTKVFTTPFKAFFKNFNNKGENTLELLGRQGVLTTALSGDKLTTLEISVMDDPIKILVQSKNGASIAANTTVEVVNELKNKSIYLIQPINY